MPLGSLTLPRNLHPETRGAVKLHQAFFEFSNCSFSIEGLDAHVTLAGSPLPLEGSSKQSSQINNVEKSAESLAKSEMSEFVKSYIDVNEEEFTSGSLLAPPGTEVSDLPGASEEVVSVRVLRFLYVNLISFRRNYW